MYWVKFLRSNSKYNEHIFRSLFYELDCLPFKTHLNILNILFNTLYQEFGFLKFIIVLKNLVI